MTRASLTQKQLADTAAICC